MSKAEQTEPTPEPSSDAQPVEPLTLKVKAQDGSEIFFKIKPGTQLKKLMDSYCQRQGVDIRTVRFLYEGNRIQETTTPRELNMNSGDEIDAMESKAYEEALEQEIANKDSIIAELRIRVEELTSEVAKTAEKYRRTEYDLAQTQDQATLLLKELETFRAEKRELELLNDDWERSKRSELDRILEFSNQELEQKLTHAEEYMIMYKEELDEVSSQNEIEIQRLKDEIKVLKDDLAQVQTHKNPQGDIQMKLLEDALQTAIEEKVKLKSELEKPKVHRTTCTTFDFLPEHPVSNPFPMAEHEDQDSELNQGGQTIRVLARVRALMSNEACTPCLTCTPYVIASTSIEAKTKDLTIKKAGKFVMKQFLFERVFGVSATNEDVFQACSSNVEEVALGGSVCLLAYGQTGSGKTYTMRGLVEKSVELVLSGLKNSQAEVSLQCVEVYNDQVRNLFTQESEGRVNKLKDFLSKATVPILDYSSESVITLIAETIESRTTKFTEANERSSRSHLLITVLIKRGDVVGRLIFVDLAGSERLNTSKAKGDMSASYRLKETLCINKSLTALQDVIAALESKANHVPYRNSILTTLLQPVLSSSASKVIMLVMVSPSEDALGESICTLSLGVRLKSVELGINIRQSLKDRNSQSEQVERTLTLLEREREEKFSLIRLKEKLERDLGSYLQAMKDKDNKLTVLSNRVKQLERESFDSMARLKKEAEDYKQQFHQTNRKLRQVQAKAESEKIQKNSSAKKLDHTPSTPPQITIEEIPHKSVALSTSPTREIAFNPINRQIQSRIPTVSKQWLTPTSKKPTRELLVRPQSVTRLTETRIPKTKVVTSRS